MTLSKEQLQTIAEMMFCQSVYFRTRSPYMLTEAKKREKKVQGYIAAWLLSGEIIDPKHKFGREYEQKTLF